MKINLLPGIPDDDNRDYLPEYLKDSEIVVNENGNNSQVYPKRLEEKKEEWKVYAKAVTDVLTMEG